MEAADAQESEFAAVTGRWCKGLARINLAALDFDFSLQQGHRQASNKIVSALEKKVEIAGCQRRDEKNYANAIVDGDALRTALAAAGFEETALPREDNAAIPYLHSQTYFEEDTFLTRQEVSRYACFPWSGRLVEV